MKKGFLLQFMMLLCALMGGVVSANAADVKSTLTFTKACGGSGTADDGTKWTVTSDGAESDFDSTSGIHYGTGKKNVTYLQLSTSDIQTTVTKVVVNTRDAQAKATVTVTVGGSAFGESKTATSTSTDYTFEGSASGEIIVKVDRGSSMTKAIYVKSIEVTYSDGSSLETPNFEFGSSEAVALIGGESEFPTLTNNSDGEVTYTSTNPDVATINENGEITLVAEGKTTIKATVAETDTYASGTASYELTVIQVEDGVFDFSKGYDYGSGIECKNANTYNEDPSSWLAGNILMDVIGKYRWWSNDNTLRVYSGNSITFFAPAGKVITNIVFNNTKLEGFTPNVGEMNSNEWTGTAALVEFSSTGSSVFSKITVTYQDAPAATVSVGETGFATFTPAWDVDFSNSAIKAYTATVDGENIALSKIDVVPAGTGVLVYYADGAKTEEIPAATEAGSAPSNNAFVGTLTEIASLATEGAQCKNYILNVVDGKVGFYRAAGNRVAAGKAYLSVPASETAEGAKDFYALNIEDAVVTGINEVKTVKGDNVIYNLNGVRVKDMNQKGVYIVNGKKVVVK